MIDPSSKARSNSSPWTGLRQSRLRPAVAGLMLIDEKEESAFSIVRNLQSDDSEPATATEPPSASELPLCNEAKCLSTGLFPGKMFNCYGQGPNTLFPFLCADEWIGIEITSLDVATPEYPNMKYYTCFPPLEGADELPTSSQQELQRHCLDPQLQPQPLDGDSDSDMDMDTDTDISSICAKKYPSTYQYGREMTQISGIPDAYMCCNNDDFDDDDDGDFSITTGPGIATTPTNEIDDPVQLCYPNIWCSSQSCKVTNSFFNLQRMNCANDVYRYPELIEITGNTGMYQCCSLEEELLAMARRKRLLSSMSTTNTNTNSTTTSTTTPTKLNNGSFLMDTSAFNATIYTQFIIALIASLLSFTLIVAISVSLYKMKKKSKQKNQCNNYGRRTSAPDYSSYNLYLVFWCTPDLIYNIFTMAVVMKSDYNGWIPETNALITMCATINMYMNCIIAHEVMVLLRRSKNIQRYTPPSYKKASIQLFVVTIYAITLGLLWYFVILPSSNERCPVAIPWRQYSLSVFYILVIGIPLVYLCYVCFIIWKQELFPKDQVTLTVVPRRPRISRFTNSLSTEFQDLCNNTLQRIGILFSRSRTTTSTSNNNDQNNNTTATTNAIDSTKTKKEDNTNNNGFTPILHGSSTNNSTTAAANTGDGDSDNNTINDNNNVVAKIATTSNNNNNDATPHSQPTSFRTTNTSPTTVTATTTTTSTPVICGRLNILVMYFMRIILVFFFVWLPGMVMYYIAYEANRTSAGVLQNTGFLFFSLQAIVSCSMAMSKPDVRKAVYDLYDDIVRILFGGIIKYIKNRRQEKKEEEHHEKHGESSTTPVSSKFICTKLSAGNAAVDIENGNDSNKSDNFDNNDDNNHDLKEIDVSLPRMIEETECDDNDDVEAQSSSLTQSTNATERSDGSTNIKTMSSPTTSSTMLTNEERHSNKKVRNIKNGSLDKNAILLQSMVDQETNIIEDDNKKKSKKHSKKKKKKKLKGIKVDKSSAVDNDENDDNAAQIIDDINDTVETKPPSSKKKTKNKKKTTITKDETNDGGNNEDKDEMKKNDDERNAVNHKKKKKKKDKTTNHLDDHTSTKEDTAVIESSPIRKKSKKKEKEKKIEAGTTTEQQSK